MASKAYCDDRNCNEYKELIEYRQEITNAGYTVWATSYLCPHHYKQFADAIYDEQSRDVQMPWPEGAQKSFPACAESPRGDVWNWRPRVGETPAQRAARVEQDKAAYAYRQTQEFKASRQQSLGPFNVPEFPCEIWEAGKLDHDVVVSFVEADVYTEDILDMLALNGDYARRVTFLEAAE